MLPFFFMVLDTQYTRIRGVWGAGVLFLVGRTEQVSVFCWGGFWCAIGDGAAVGRQALAVLAG